MKAAAAITLCAGLQHGNDNITPEFWLFVHGARAAMTRAASLI